MTEPKSMDPERLALARHHASPMMLNVLPACIIELRVLLAELLADRDYQERRADGAEREREEARLELTREIAESKRLADLIDGDEAGHEIMDPAQWLAIVSGDGSAIDRLIALDRAYVSHYRIAVLIKTAEDEAAALRSSEASARAEVTRLRARVRVEAEDVERAGVKRAQVGAWLCANGYRHQDRDYPRADATWESPAKVLIDDGTMQAVVFLIRGAASSSGRPGLDILDEMAAMVVE